MEAANLTSQDIFIVLQKDISGEDATGRVDYAIKSLEDLLCITEGKPRNIKIQNLAQLESAFQTNKKKRTADQAFGNDYFDYIYGIVTTENPELLRNNVKRVIGIIVGLLKDRCVKGLFEMESKIDLLRQENARLVAKNNKEVIQTELKVLRKLNSMTEVMLQRNTMFEAKISELKAKDPDRMIKISEVMPVEDTKLRKKFIKQIEKFEKSFIDHMDHL
ncbi:hypothetical protein C1645_827230 [Glomus cerebriforme]|uniref:Uncharacterized protein n=1 Tax=Glomus cerebriforme TaxID=658196 RepID=A0A397SP72_9GLOM|nr:hypothetical protein C1645_827230 [Glomus cerebriforme]